MPTNGKNVTITIQADSQVKVQTICRCAALEIPAWPKHTATFPDTGGHSLEVELSRRLGKDTSGPGEKQSAPSASGCSKDVYPGSQGCCHVTKDDPRMRVGGHVGTSMNVSDADHPS
jgi:hypothetical protein